MEFEGVLRQLVLARGEYEDVAVYAILSSDHPQPMPGPPNSQIGSP